MMRARVAAGLAASAALLLFGCSTGGQAPETLTAAAPTGAEAAAPIATPAIVDNFMLADTDYMGHELYRTDAKVIVLISQANGCPIVRNLAPAIRALKARYAGQGVEFLMLNSAVQDGMDEIAKEKAEFDFGVPILKDANQLVGEQLGVVRTGEFFVVDAKTWKIAYRGPLDDRLNYGTQKASAEHNWAADAIDATLAGRPAAPAGRASPGCLIDFPERGKVAQISYARDVAPILERKCAHCHTEGGIGPFAMSSYAMVKGFSPMIREVLRTDRMPPWNVDPHVGRFADDRSLTPTETKTLVHWVEQGAPRGGGTDPLAAAAKTRVVAEWPMGKPDLILEIPAYAIPATGVVDYQRPIVVNPLKEGRWIRASAYVVGQRQGVHHFLSGYLADIPADGRANEARWGASMGGYAVGAEATHWPQNVGTYLPPGGAIGFQAHYTPFGKAATDRSLLGLYFYKENEKPGLVMRNSVIVDNTIRIPAGEARHEETAWIDVPKDMLLYSAFPHAHYRGYASDLWLQTPDGVRTRLLAMPRYDFNWQREYSFAEPIRIPAGSKLIAHYWYDNSRQNPANPDPTRNVVWGDQSWEEMFYTAIRYRWTEETAAHQLAYDQLIDRTRLLGMFDDNLDGKIEKAELKGELGDKLAPFFAQIDRNQSGAIENLELLLALRAMGDPAGPPRAQQGPMPARPSGGGGVP